MSQITCLLAVKNILRYDSVEPQHDEIQRLLYCVMRKHTLEIPANRGGIKIDVKEYDVSETKSLLRWFCETDQAIIARHYTDEQIQVPFMMSKVAGQAQYWAYGLLMSDLNSFPLSPYSKRTCG